jgi:hypothetical protein
MGSAKNNFWPSTVPKIRRIDEKFEKLVKI